MSLNDRREEMLTIPAELETEEDRKAWERLVALVRDRRGVDLQVYKSSFLLRRVATRMRACRAQDLSRYVWLLERDQGEELEALFRALTINLTRFFRDEQVFRALRERVIPALLRVRADRRVFRAWSVGCASGEEAYSLAMVVADVLGEEVSEWHVEILGTDLDREVLERAREGVYAPESFEGLDPAWWKPYVEVLADGSYRVVEWLRRWVRFLQHDVLCDALPGKKDVVLCRNVFIYMERHWQVEILERLEQVLAEDGVLVLGQTEVMPFVMLRRFVPWMPDLRIYRRRWSDSGR